MLDEVAAQPHEMLQRVMTPEQVQDHLLTAVRRHVEHGNVILLSLSEHIAMARSVIQREVRKLQEQDIRVRSQTCLCLPITGVTAEITIGSTACLDIRLDLHLESFFSDVPPELKLTKDREFNNLVATLTGTYGRKRGRFLAVRVAELFRKAKACGAQHYTGYFVADCSDVSRMLMYNEFTRVTSSEHGCVTDAVEFKSFYRNTTRYALAVAYSKD